MPDPSPAPPQDHTEEPGLLRSVLRDQVKDRILQDIIQGRYPPGTRLIETRIARELRVSQAPVREPVEWVGTTAAPVRAVAILDE